MTFSFQKQARTKQISHNRPSSKTKTWAWSRWTRKRWCSSKPTSPRPRPPLPPSRTTTSRAIRRPKWRLEIFFLIEISPMRIGKFEIEARIVSRNAIKASCQLRGLERNENATLIWKAVTALRAFCFYLNKLNWKAFSL